MARSQVSGSGEAAQELMRLAGDPLEIHRFLRRGGTPSVAHLGKIRAPVLDLEARGASNRTLPGSRDYVEMQDRHPPSLAPEAFNPSDDDLVQAFTILPEPQMNPPTFIGCAWQVIAMGAGAAILLFALMRW